MAAPATKRSRTVRSLLTVAGSLLLGLALAPAGAAASTPTVSAFDSLATIRSDQSLPPGGSASAEISAAGNEFESFQIAVQAGSTPLSSVRVDPGRPLTGPGGARIPASTLTIYREVDYHVSQPSDNEGGTGDWPDALIPERDYFYGEDRNAFPVDLAADQRLASWVDVLVPDGAPAGDYTGSIVVTAGGGTVAEVPIHLTVYAFSIPSTSSLPSAFLADPWQICYAHTGGYGCNNQDSNSWKLHALYLRAGLENRITLSNGLQFAYNDAPSTSTARNLFAQYAVPLLQGTDSSLRLRGAKLTTVGAYRGCVNATNGCLQTWKDLASQYGFSSRSFVYLCDEPYADSSVWPTCAATADRSEQIWPGVRKLVTTSMQDALTRGGGWSGALRYTDLLTPVINQMIGSGGSTRPSYDSFLDPANNAPGTASNELWLYTSCLSYSCDASESPAGTQSRWAGWPGYAIDQPASQARAMGWQAFEYGATGELYWNAAYSLSHTWTDQYFAGGNGDGNLFYPGRPNGTAGSVAIGGTRDIPIESMRMKRIRDGREDYEYLHILAQQGRASDASKVVQGLLGSQDTAARSSTVSYGALSDSRAQLAALIAPSATERTLTVSVAGAGTGSVTGPGIDCPGDCTETYSDGASVTLNARPTGGSTFGGWGEGCTGSGSCWRVMSSDKSAGATFNPAPLPAPPNDTTPPETTIIAGPSGEKSDRTPTFYFTSSEPNSTFQCRKDSGAWYSCSSRRTLKRLTYGLHTFCLRARDAAGNWDPTPESRSFGVVKSSPSRRPAHR